MKHYISLYLQYKLKYILVNREWEIKYCDYYPVFMRI